MSEKNKLRKESISVQRDQLVTLADLDTFKGQLLLEIAILFKKETT